MISIPQVWVISQTRIISIIIIERVWVRVIPLVLATIPNCIHILRVILKSGACVGGVSHFIAKATRFDLSFSFLVDY